MSVWTRVETKALKENVDMVTFKEAIKELGITLDFGTTTIQNSYGSSKVDAAMLVKGKPTALGIVINSKKGVELVGDSWKSGIVGAHQEAKLSNMMSQAYQKIKIKKELELQGWAIDVIQKNNTIELECCML